MAEPGQAVLTLLSALAWTTQIFTICFGSLQVSIIHLTVESRIGADP